MKKLMIAALAVASCTAFAEDVNLTENAVYDLSFTTKYLDFPKKSAPAIKFTEKKLIAKNLDDAKTQWEALDKEELLEECKFVVFRGAKESEGGVKKLAGKVIAVYNNMGCRDAFKEKTEGLPPGEVGSYKETVQNYPVYELNENGQAKAVTNMPVIKTITYKVIDHGKSSGKLVSKNLAGMLIVDKGVRTAYIWDAAVKDFVGGNEFAGSKGGKSVQLATTSESDSKGFKFLKLDDPIDGKNIDGGFNWKHAETKTGVQGWGSGTIKDWPLNKKLNENVKVVNTIAGSFAGVTENAGVVPAQGEYGTWKLTYNDKATQILMCQDSPEGEAVAKLLKPSRTYDGKDYNGIKGTAPSYVPESYEEILGTKKVEIMVD